VIGRVALRLAWRQARGTPHPHSGLDLRADLLDPGDGDAGVDPRVRLRVRIRRLVERRVGRPKHCHALRGFGDPSIGFFAKPSGPDQDRNSRADRPLETGLQSIRRRKIDQHIAIVGDFKVVRLGNGGCNRLAHAAIGGEEADADSRHCR